MQYFIFSIKFVKWDCIVLKSYLAYYNSNSQESHRRICGLYRKNVASLQKKSHRHRFNNKWFKWVITGHGYLSGRDQTGPQVDWRSFIALPLHSASCVPQPLHFVLYIVHAINSIQSNSHFLKKAINAFISWTLLDFYAI